MQIQGLPGNQTILGFNDIAPPATSTRRVAASAFHHCLGMYDTLILDLLFEHLSITDYIGFGGTKSFELTFSC